MKYIVRVQLSFIPFYCTSTDPAKIIRFILERFEDVIENVIEVDSVPPHALLYDIDLQEFVDEVQI